MVRPVLAAMDPLVVVLFTFAGTALYLYLDQ